MGQVQGLDSYRNAQKKNWRGWLWNRIVERLLVPVEEAVVLYLCGPEDLDREKALARGFCNENLIAVDMSEKNVQRVRRGGGLGICHDLHELLRGWPADWPVDVVVADYCAGLTPNTYQLAVELVYSAAVCQPGRPTTVAVNLQRGRDAWSNGIRANNVDRSTNHHLVRDGVADTNKHRGWQWYMYYTWEWVSALTRTQGMAEDEAQNTVGTACSSGIMRTRFNSYRASRVFMDSMVFVPLVRSIDGVYPGPEVAAARRKIAACRAIRTVKIREQAA